MNLHVALFLLAAASAAETAPEAMQGLAWRWNPGETRQYYFEDEVHLPLWWEWSKERNAEARVVAWSLKSVLNCVEKAPAGKHAWDVECSVVDLGLQAAPVPGDAANLPGIVDEFRTKLVGAKFVLRLRDDGRLTDIGLEGVDKRDSKNAAIAETLRLVMVRALAGLDVELPKGGASPDGIWSQYESYVLMAPSFVGSEGGCEVMNKVYEVHGDNAVIATAGKAMIAPTDAMGDDPSDLFATKIEGASVFDTKRGVLTERVWRAVGTPTASSAIAEGTAGFPYEQNGRLFLVEAGQPMPEVGPTGIMAAPTTPTAIGQMVPMGPP